MQCPSSWAEGSGQEPWSVTLIVSPLQCTREGHTLVLSQYPPSTLVSFSSFFLPWRLNNLYLHKAVSMANYTSKTNLNLSGHIYTMGRKNVFVSKCCSNIVTYAQATFYYLLLRKRSVFYLDLFTLENIFKQLTLFSFFFSLNAGKTAAQCREKGREGKQKRIISDDLAVDCSGLMTEVRRDRPSHIANAQILNYVPG